MPSSNKTDYLKLNKWINNDTLQVEDFMDDNEKIDAEFLERGVNVNWFPRIVPENDDTGRIQRALDSSVGKTVKVPDGTYNISATLNLPVGASLELSKNATIKAMAVMESVINTPLTTPHEYGLIKGGNIDCNDLADNGIHIRYAKQFLVKDTFVHKAKKAYYKCGDSLASGSSYEIFLQNINANRPSGSIAPVGSIGIQTVNCHDGMINNALIVGAETGVEINGGDNHLTNIHCWNRPSNGQMKYCFVANGLKNFWTNCTADTPTVYGFWVKKYNNHFSNCHVYNGQSGPVDGLHPDGKWDNTLIGVYIEATGDYGAYYSFNFTGESDTRILKDFDGAITNNVILGNSHNNVTTITGQRVRSITGYDIVTENQLKSKKGVYLEGAEGDAFRSLYITTNGTNKWRIGSDSATGASDAGLSVMAYPDGGGSIEAMWLSRTSGNITMNKSAVILAGTYDKPLKLGTNALWVSADGKLRIKNGTPANDTDGVVVGSQV